VLSGVAAEPPHRCFAPVPPSLGRRGIRGTEGAARRGGAVGRSEGLAARGEGSLASAGEALRAVGEGCGGGGGRSGGRGMGRMDAGNAWVEALRAAGEGCGGWGGRSGGGGCAACFPVSPQNHPTVASLRSPSGGGGCAACFPVSPQNHPTVASLRSPPPWEGGEFLVLRALRAVGEACLPSAASWPLVAWSPTPDPSDLRLPDRRACVGLAVSPVGLLPSAATKGTGNREADTQGL
jgi:hypothetical protein